MYKTFESSEGNVTKYVFTEEDYVAETILYKYGEYYTRTVICCSTQSGCPVGCRFCGTGNKFIRNLSSFEIVNQITTVLADKNIEDINQRGIRFQIMFMSMGEPMLNWENVDRAVRTLHKLYPNAELLLSTIGVNDNDVFRGMLRLSRDINKVGLQFSIHKSTNVERGKLIPFANKWTLNQIRDAGIMWWRETGRKPYLNYCIDGTNNSDADYRNLTALFSPIVFNMTFSVVCSSNETMKDAGYSNLETINEFQNRFLADGYNTRVFNPAGQDDIGGGCGQLWYVQQWMKEHK